MMAAPAHWRQRRPSEEVMTTGGAYPDAILNCETRRREEEEGRSHAAWRTELLLGGGGSVRLVRR